MRWHPLILTAAGMLAGALVLPQAARADRSTDLELRSRLQPTHTPQVGAYVARYDSAWSQRDTSAVSALLAPQYQYFTSLGAVSSRAETMAMLSDPGYRLERADRSEITVARSGPVAVVSSRWQGHGSYRGQPFNDDQRCGQTWLLRDRTWQLLSEHCVQIA